MLGSLLYHKIDLYNEWIGSIEYYDVYLPNFYRHDFKRSWYEPEALQLALL